MSVRIRRRATAGAVTLLTAALAVAGAVAIPTAANADSATGTTPSTSTGTSSSVTEPITGKAYQGSPDREARLVTAENERIYNVRALASAARWSGVSTDNPYRLATGDSYTLVLVARKSPYTLADLKKLAPSTFVQQPDGSWLLSENIVVENGATLRLQNADGMHIHLQSNNRGFVSIVTQAGSLQVLGSAKEPVTIDAWDPQSGSVDRNTSDGRSYVRVQGGSATLKYVRFQHLGFWSGTTGGVSLTGTTLSSVDTAASAASAVGPDASPQDVFGSTLMPAGSVGGATPGNGSKGGGYSYVSALVQHVQFDGNAYGLFLTSAEGITMSDSSITGSLIDGLVLHRYVTNSTFNTVVSKDNAVDGVKMTRASTGIVMSQVTANGNGRNGITLNGSALADGPNAVGMPTGDYGNNSLTDSTASRNGRYGVEVLGGENVRVSGSTVDDNTMGIVVAQAADKTVVHNNSVSDSTSNGIAVLGGARRAEVSDNTVTGADIGVYSRDSASEVQGNRIKEARTHGVTVVGASTGTSVTDNEVSGSGPSAVDLARSDGATQQGNDTDDWRSTKPLLVTLKAIFQPLTVMWLLLLLIVLIAAVGGVVRRRRGEQRAHPYAGQAPLSSFTKGMVDPTTLGLPAAPHTVSAGHGAPGGGDGDRDRTGGGTSSAMAG